VGLKIHLDKGQRVIIGRAMVTNADHRTTLHIDGPVPILKEKDIMTAHEATTPLRQLYWLIQTLYQEEKTAREVENYVSLMLSLLNAMPQIQSALVQLDADLHDKHTYKALKILKQLIETWEPLPSPTEQDSPASAD
jgi:flagellar protein FlbT